MLQFNFDEVSTEQLLHLKGRIDAELSRREVGHIPHQLQCSVCRMEIVGDSEKLNESERICKDCYNTFEDIARAVAEFQAENQDEETRHDEI